MYVFNFLRLLVARSPLPTLEGLPLVLSSPREDHDALWRGPIDVPRYVLNQALS